MTILVTGGAGFIGSNLLHHLVNVIDDEIICIDNLTYASDWHNIPDSVKLYTTDIVDEHNCEYIFKKYKPKTIFHLAAESHVDNSIKDCSKFIHTNIIGTVNLLKLSLKYEIDRFMHISTDEVYGTIDEDSFTEKSNYDPRNPYSASKASSDHFVKAFHNTYGLPVIITNCSNNYGPRQYKEKLIPQTILNLLDGKKVPIYGDGKQIRDWLYVQDHCEALFEVWSRGRIGQKYNIGGECEVKNIDLVRMILDYLNMSENMIEYVKDRPGHDRRYSTSITKIRHEIKWNPRFNLEEGLEKTIKWYECNRNNS
jgi:dTDP-glucose 4,6-dehydratase